MKITKSSWDSYISKLGRIDRRAAIEMEAWLNANGTLDTNILIEQAYAIANKYGHAAASLACQMYDNVAEASGAAVPAAEPAEAATMQEVAKAVNATKDSKSRLISAISRLPKQTAADTILKNVNRDGAEFAWIPSGDTCAYCFAISAKGWTKASSEVMKGNHAEHIHANCDCTFAIRFSKHDSVEGYDPEAMRKEYMSMGTNSYSRTRNLRRKFYAQNKDKINAQKRALYAKNKSKIKFQSFPKGKAEPFSCADITKELNKNSSPGIGTIEFQNKTSESDRRVTDWLHRTFGGDIICIEDNPQKGKMPDAIWNGVYFEYKAPTTKNAISDRIKRASQQLYEALKRDDNLDATRGLAIDISNNSMTDDEAVKYIEHCVRNHCKGETIVIIHKNEELVKALNIK